MKMYNRGGERNFAAYSVFLCKDNAILLFFQTEVRKNLLSFGLFVIFVAENRHRGGKPSDRITSNVIS